MSEGAAHIQEKIRSFKRKYYLNLFIRGAILTLTILLGYYLLASLLEHAFWLSQWARLIILLLFFAVAGICVFRFLNQPLQWWIARRGLNDEQTAQLIGNAFPTVRDRLLNLIQLATSGRNSVLAVASVQQKSKEFEPLAFDAAIDFGDNKRYLKYLSIPLALVIIIFLFNRSILTKSTERLVHFNREYSPEAPFRFEILNTSMSAFHNEDFVLSLKLDGEAVPANAYLVLKNQRLKLSANGDGQFSYTFERLQQPLDLQVEAAGFFSDPIHVDLINRPELTRFSVELDYPKYIQKADERLANAGNLEIPEGTVVKWKLNTSHAENALISFQTDTIEHSFQRIEDQNFAFEKTFTNADLYEIRLRNDKSSNKEKIAYSVNVIKDEFPQISVNNFRDSVLYQRIILGGAVADDYGVTDLQLHYKILDEDKTEVSKRSQKIAINRNLIQQNFFFNWSVDSLKLKPGQQLEYFLQVWDNDGVNGRKSTRSANYSFLVPTQDNLVAEISKSQNQTEKRIDQSVTKATKLQDKIEEANQMLKGKQSLDWQDKKMLEDILQQKQGLDQLVQQLQEENKLLDEKKDAFTEQNERIKEKTEQLQKLMDQLLDEETKKLFEELQKLLKENADVSEMQKLMEKLNQNSDNLEKELERTLELFKELQYEFKLDQAVQDLKKQVEKQQDILEKTESLTKDKKDGKKDNKGNQNQQDAKKDQPKEDGGNDENSNDETKSPEELAKEQEALKEEFKKTTEKFKELEKLGEELNKEEALPDEQQSNEVQEEQQQSEEMLKQNEPSKATKPQKQALQKMQKMQQQMETMQSDMMMEMDMENLEALRQIIHGLVKLSFDQENLMKQFNELQQSDPRFNVIAQNQMKVKDDAKVLEDSLLALGKRDPMMGSFITKEIGELNDHLGKVIEANRERRRPQASNEMQLTMTSINNLALMLDDHFDMMMQMMANAKPSMKKSKQKGNKPSLSQMQQQLNERIQQLKQGGKGGREMSEELAEMAAEQERIRRALQEMQEKLMKEGKNPGGDLPAKMEQTEMDLVNKQLTDQLIRRQKEIMTRLLETEKSMREQDMDEERKGETAKDYEKEVPKAFEEYLRLKEKEVELLKTVPPKLYPYYKREVSEYFKRLGTK